MMKTLSLDRLKYNQYLWLLMIITIGFLMRLWLLDKRWINPDEGAHLMDGRLVLDGFVPGVDYDSRQVIYVYIIALFLKIFGASYLNARFLPLVSIMLVSLFIFLISKKLFNEKIALLASAIYTFLPLSIIWSVVVKTEPMTTLLSCMGIYFAICGVKNEKGARFLFLAGISLSLAYYIRQSSLAIPMAIFLFFLFFYQWSLKKVFRSYAIMLGGYILVCLLVSTYYSQFLSLTQIWHSSLNPSNIFFEQIQNVFNPQIAQGSAEIDNFRLADQPWKVTIATLRWTLKLNSFLIIGLLFSFGILVFSWLTRKNNGEDFDNISPPLVLLYSWLFSLSMGYSYWILHRGFFTQYFGEFLPPLTIILAFVIFHSLSKLKIENNLGRNTITLALFLGIIFTLHQKIPYLPSSLYPLITISVLAILCFFQSLNIQKKSFMLMACIGILAVSLIRLELGSFIPYIARALSYSILVILLYSTIFIISGLKIRNAKWPSFITVSFIISAFAFSFALSGGSMGVAFDCNWSPATVRRVSNYIKMNARDNDQVMSGALIWEFESDRRPFMYQTHPLAYRPGISKEELKKMEEYLSEYPPRFIVLDGYTEQTYLRHVEKLQSIIDKKYELKKVFNGSQGPVRIYKQL
ncbi:MAG: hypothetical protein A3G93_16510 [Nitrospinae bacterium RIFCSPLOWO2_12_FULL_45_22]|nr:MAG: hypothetical protein A3G93_16510 [Nitrospinae bacterium RIFCSPLOWO2_12_FULL_45_22]